MNTSETNEQPDQSILRDVSDVAETRESKRLDRLRKLALILVIPAALLYWRISVGEPFTLTGLSLPQIDPIYLMMGVFFLF